MTLDEYLSPKLFPLTTREGLTPREQFRLNAADLDRLREVLGTDTTPTERQWLILAELEDKAAARPELLAQLGGEADGG